MAVCKEVKHLFFTTDAEKKNGYIYSEFIVN